MQISRVKPGNRREGAGRAGGMEDGGRDGGGREGTRAKPGNQLVIYKINKKKIV